MGASPLKRGLSSGRWGRLGNGQVLRQALQAYPEGFDTLILHVITPDLCRAAGTTNGTTLAYLAQLVRASP